MTAITKFTAESEQQLRDMWPDRSITTTEMATRLHVSQTTIARWARGFGLEPRRRDFRIEHGGKQLRKERLRLLWNEPMTIPEIADSLKISPSTVGRWRRALNLPARGRGPGRARRGAADRAA